MRDELMHSRTKGSKNKKGHKYIAIKNGRYVYDSGTNFSGGGGKFGNTSHSGSSGKFGNNYPNKESKKKDEKVTREKNGITTYRGAANATSGKNAQKITKQKKHQTVAKNNAGAYRGGGQTNSEKLLAAQRKKQRTIGQKVNANAKKLQRALNRIMSHPFKSIQGAYAKSKAKKTGGGNFTKLLNEARKNYKRKPWKSKNKR